MAGGKLRGDTDFRDHCFVSLRALRHAAVLFGNAALRS